MLKVTVLIFFVFSVTAQTVKYSSTQVIIKKEQLALTDLS